MKKKFILLFAGLTLSLYALPDYTVYYTLPKVNNNTPEEIAKIKEQIKECYQTVYEHKNHVSCSNMRNDMYRNNPLLRSTAKTKQPSK